MTYKEDMLGALSLVASLHPVKDVVEACGYHIVTFEGTTATLSMDGKEVTKEEIQQVIDEVKADQE